MIKSGDELFVIPSLHLILDIHVITQMSTKNELTDLFIHVFMTKFLFYL